MEVGLFSVIFLVVVNIAAVAYTYGKLTQKVVDLCRRIDNIEKLVTPEISKRRKLKDAKR